MLWTASCATPYDGGLTESIAGMKASGPQVLWHPVVLGCPNEGITNEEWESSQPVNLHVTLNE